MKLRSFFLPGTTARCHRSALLLAALLSGCIDPYEATLPPSSSYLVVEGQVTDQPGSHWVKLSTSGRFGSVLTPNTQPAPLSLALVTLADDEGSLVPMTEASPGYYVADFNFRGVVGRSYHVTIQRADGRRYRSLPEKLLPQLPFDTLYGTFRNSEFFRDRLHEVFVEVPLLPEGGRFFRWRLTSYVPFFTTLPIEPGPPANPPPCCTTCWRRTDNGNDIWVGPERPPVGDRIRSTVAFVPYLSRTRYMFRVEQYAISERAYNFWRRVRDLQTEVGGLFDPPPTALTGNLVSDDDASEPVFGYFTVASQIEKIDFLDRNDAPVGPPVFEVPVQDCRLFPKSQAEAPEGWIY